MRLIVDCIDEDEAFAMPLKADIQRWVHSAWLSADEGCELTVINQSKEAIQALNRDFRAMDKATNVLAFPMHEMMEGRMYLGDVICCGEVIKEEAFQQHKKLAHHWAHLVVHAVLHLQSYTHDHDKDAERMEAMEVKILQSLDIPNPY